VKPTRASSLTSAAVPGRPPAPAGAAGLLAAFRATADLDRWLLVVLAVGLAVRLVAFGVGHDLPLERDEIQYQDIAVNLAEGRGFAMEGRLTSWRPPLYPALMAMLYRVTGTTDPVVVRLFQILLSLGTVVLVFGLAARLSGRRVARAAAAVMAFYPSLLFYNNHVLTEVLFIFLCVLTAYGLVAYLDTPRARYAAGAGLALGLAVLTREIVWPTVFLMSVLMGWGTRLGWRRWAAHSALLMAALLVVTVPWAIRNTRLQGVVTLIATNGGPVFLAGNYEHTPWDRPWQANALPGELKVRRLFSPDLSEGVVNRLAVQRALDYIREHPWITLRNGVIRTANLWGLEREMTGVLARGDYGRVSGLVMIAVTAVLNVAYLGVLLPGLAVLFLKLGRGPGAAWNLYVLGMIAFTTLAHAPVSAHPRYHLPLIPLLILYAVQARDLRGELRAAHRAWPGRALLVCTGLLLMVWIRDVMVDLERFLKAARFL
jgi:4-amino-4-deoxy-L-arabinose transferase-like glycosyltransferase